MIRAYVLIETTADKAGAVRDTAGHNLMNCKAIAETLWPSEVVVHLEATDAESLQEAIVRRLPQLDGVRRVTTWAVFQK